MAWWAKVPSMSYDEECFNGFDELAGRVGKDIILHFSRCPFLPRARRARPLPVVCPISRSARRPSEQCGRDRARGIRLWVERAGSLEEGVILCFLTKCRAGNAIIYKSPFAVLPYVCNSKGWVEGGGGGLGCYARVNKLTYVFTWELE